MCDEVIDADAKLRPKNYDKAETIPTKFNKKNQPVKQKFFIFHSHFY